MIWLGLLASLLLLGAGAAAYTRWFARQAVGNFAYCRVELLEGDEEAKTTAEVTLVGTPRAYRVVRLTHEPNPDQPALPIPSGHHPEPDNELGPGTVSWVPDAAVRIKPEHPLRVEFAYDPSTTESTRVTGWLETKIGVGGGGTFFHVPVGPISGEQRDMRNLESRVRAECVRRGIRPVDHPEWNEVLRRRGTPSG